MKFFNELLRILDTRMEAPKPYGAFHLFFFALSLLAALLLCITHKKADPKRPFTVAFWVAAAVFVLEIYKQVNFSFSYGDAIKFDYQWYAFPWQFCSTPMYAGLLTVIFRRGKVHDALCAFLATYALFAGACVMFSPSDVFCAIMGINIQTMICHGSMLTVGIYLLYSQYVKLEHKTILGAMCVFGVAIVTAIALNEITYLTGITDGETFNMFFISRHYDTSLPVYSAVQSAVPYTLSVIIYFTAFSLAAYLILLAAMAIKKIYLSKKKKAL